MGPSHPYEGQSGCPQHFDEFAWPVRALDDGVIIYLIEIVISVHIALQHELTYHLVGAPSK